MSIPLYQMIENEIREQIQTDKLKSGEMIPSENELKDHYNVSRMTVRQALNNLVNDGYLYRHKGKGTFVSKSKIEKNIHGVRSFTEEMAEMGRTTRNEVRLLEVRVPSELIKEKLFLEEGDKVIYAERIRYGDDIPVLYEELYVPYNMFKELEPCHLQNSFYEYLENDKKLQISHCVQGIEAKLATNKLATILQVNKNTPVLSIVRNTFLTDGRPFEYVISSYRADQYRFVQYSVKT